MKPKLSTARIAFAFGIALFVDALQFPITGATATGLFAIPGEIADIFLDLITMVAVSFLVGFHWVLLPSFLLEVVSGLDLVPTWTACVAFLVFKRKREERNAVIEVETMPSGPAHVLNAPPPLPAPALSLPTLDVDERLEKLAELQRRGLITEEEFSAKKREILRDL